MSNFYRNYIRKEVRQTIINNWLKQHPKKKEQDVPEKLLKENHGWYPKHIAREIALKEWRRQNLRQANGYTTGKHTGSKSGSRLNKNVTMGIRRLKHIYAQYAKAGLNGPAYTE